MIVAAAFAVVTISACEKTVAEEELIALVGSNVVKIGAEASDVRIAYTLSADGEVSAGTNADWLVAAEDAQTKLVAGAERSVLLKASANTSSGSRTAVVSLEMKGAKTVRVTVIQGADSDYVTPSGMTFDLSTSDVTESSVLYTVAPNLQDRYYVLAFVHADEWAQYDGSPKAYVDKAVAEMQEYARKYEEKYGTAFNLGSRLYKGYRTTTQNGLEPDTDYCLLTFDLSLAWGYSGNVSVARFRTAAVPPSSDAFSVSYDAGTCVITFSVASGTTGKFCYGFAPLEEWKKAGTPREMVRKYIENASSMPTFDTGQTDYAKSAPFYNYAGVESGTDWVAFVFSYNPSTEKASNIAWLQFHFQQN